MIKTFFIGIATALLGLLFFIKRPLGGDEKKELNELKIKDDKNEAEKIVKSKTAGELVDDFNKRYSGGGQDGPA